MKKLSLVCLCLSLSALLGGCSCTTVDDDAPGMLSVLAYVDDICGEDYKMTAIDEIGERPQEVLYTFKTEERGLVFTAVSTLQPITFDATVTSWYTKDISCDYPEAVHELYRERAAQALAEGIGFDAGEKFGWNGFMATSFADLEKQAEAFCKADRIYGEELEYNSPEFLQDHPLMYVNFYWADDTHLTQDSDRMTLGSYAVDGSWSEEALYAKLSGAYAQAYVDGKISDGSDIPKALLDDYHVSILENIYLNGVPMSYNTVESPYSTFQTSTSDYKFCWYSQEQQSYMLVCDIGCTSDISQAPMIIEEYVKALGGTCSTSKETSIKDTFYMTQWTIGTDTWNLQAGYDTGVTTFSVEKNGELLDIPFITVDEDRQVGANFCVGLKAEDFVKLFGLEYHVDEDAGAIYMERADVTKSAKG